MKGFIFTLDALFSLIFAIAAISALLYLHFNGYSTGSAQTSIASHILSELSNTTIGQISSYDRYASFILSNQNIAYWPQFGADAAQSSYSSYGPMVPRYMFSITSTSNIIPSPVVADGILAFAAGNEIYSANSTYGTLEHNYPFNSPTDIVSSPVIYQGYIIFANQSNDIVAISGSNSLIRIWKTSIGNSLITTPLEIEDGSLVFGASNELGDANAYLINPYNGTTQEKDMSSNSLLYISDIEYVNNTFQIGTNNIASFSANYIPMLIHGQAAHLTQVAFNGIKYGIDYGFGIYNTPSYQYNAISVTYKANAALGGIIYPDGARTMNFTPSIAGDTGYFLINGTAFMGYNPSIGTIFNITLPNRQAPYPYSDIAIANGDAYVPNGNTVYAFGNEHIPSTTSLTSALGIMYLNGNATLADIILNGFYNSTNIGILINNTYGPTMHVSEFNALQQSHVYIPAKASLSPQAGTSGAMSMCAWYEIENLQNYNGLLFKGIPSPSNGNMMEYAVDYNGLSQGFDVWSSSGGIIASASAGNSIPQSSVGKWQFMCFAYNFNSALAYYYLNGNVYTDNSFNQNQLPSSQAGSGGLVFGAGENGYSDVRIANVQLYNTSISAEDMNQIYSQGMFGMPLSGSGLVSWWPLLGDAADYNMGKNTGFSQNIAYNPTSYTPSSLAGAYEISKATVPVNIYRNGVNRVYNISVMIWN